MRQGCRRCDRNTIFHITSHLTGNAVSTSGIQFGGIRESLADPTVSAPGNNQRKVTLNLSCRSSQLSSSLSCVVCGSISPWTRSSRREGIPCVHLYLASPTRTRTLRGGRYKLVY